MNCYENEKMLRESLVKKDDYTILLILKDRVEFTKRWLAYMSFIKFPFKIYIADGSVDNSTKDYIGGNSSFKDLDIEYVRYPYDKTYPIYYKKVADALARIKTKYVSLIDNDDFCIVEGIIKSIVFLEKNPDYSSCRGEMSAIAVCDKENKYLYGKIGEMACRGYYNISLDDEKSSDRITKHLEKYGPTFHDLHRTEHLRMCFEKLKDIAPENIYLADCLTSCMTVASGKIKRFPCLFYIKQGNSPGTCNYAESIKYDLFERMLLESWSHDFCKTAEAVAKIISQQDGITIEEAIAIFNNGYKQWVGPNIIWSVNRKRIPAKKNIFQKLALRITRKISCICKGYFFRRMLAMFGIEKKNIEAIGQLAKFLEKGRDR